MPDPSPALVDTIARAIHATYAELAQREGYSGTDLIAHLMTDYDSCLTAARAALAAMPKPIGYGVLVRPACDFHPWVDERHHTTQAHAADEAAALRVDYPDDTHIVVALVPVDGIPE